MTRVSPNWRPLIPVWFIFKEFMRNILHLLSRGEDEWPAQVIELQKQVPDTHHEVIDLRRENTDYTAVVQKIFAADSVQVW